MDGGQSYEMKCRICGEFGNIMTGVFHHSQGCPVAIEENKGGKFWPALQISVLVVA